MNQNNMNYDIMMEFKNILDSITPNSNKLNYVYHYTSLDALKNILENNEFWVSHASFMNDPQEISFGINVIVNILNTDKEKFKNVLDVIERKRKDYYDFSLDFLRDLPFIFSLSEKRDDLSQWIQYGNNGYGASFQFIHSKVLSIFTENLDLPILVYFPVQYYTSWFEQNDNNIPEFRSSIKSFYSILENYIIKQKYELDTNFYRIIYEMTKMFASIIKNDFFSNEKEWRLIVFSTVGDENIFVKSIQNSLKIIYRVNFKNNTILELFDRITIGPKHNKDNAISSAIKLLGRRTQHTDMVINYSNGIIR